MVTGEGVELERVALEETRRAQKIVRDFDIFSRAEAFERSNVLSGTELAHKLGEVAKQNLTQTETRVGSRVDPHLPSVKVSLDRLSDDFADFGHDSERHKPAGLCITISCELASEADVGRAGLQSGDSYLKLIYADNGPGVPSGLKIQIFEPFYTTTGGSGLELAIARHNARIHGGNLIECGQQGEGVRFELYLPVAQAI
jgi:signal transduction histidine kinase